MTSKDNIKHPMLLLWLFIGGWMFVPRTSLKMRGGLPACRFGQPAAPNDGAKVPRQLADKVSARIFSDWFQNNSRP
jgi:hypothetical protein